MELPDEMWLNIMANSSLRTILDLEATNSAFRMLSKSDKGESMWQQKLESRFPNAVAFKNVDRTYRDYYIALSKAFQKLDVDPRETHYPKVSAIPFVLFSTLKYDLVNVHRFNREVIYDSVPGLNLKLGADRDIYRYIISWAMQLTPDPLYIMYTMNVDNLWVKLIYSLDDMKWFYDTFNIPPNELDFILHQSVLTQITLDELKYILSIYKGNLKTELDKILALAETLTTGPKVPQDIKKYLYQIRYRS